MPAQQYPKTFCPMPGINGGMLSPENLQQITDIVDRYKIPMVKVTGAQRLYFHGLEPAKLAELKRELQIPDNLPHLRNRVHYVQACPGKKWCRYGRKNTSDISAAISGMELSGPLPYKVKVGISACQICCCESWMRDIGLAAEKNGWRLSFGGNGGSRPRIGDLVADGLSDDEVLKLIERTLNYYLKTAKYKTRSSLFMGRIGIDELRRNVLM
jgi:NAD(P)H-nitrite reductase large subunit